MPTFQLRSITPGLCWIPTTSQLQRTFSLVQAIAGQNLAIREAREDLQIAQLQFQFAQLFVLEENGNTLAAKARQSIYQKLTRLTLDIAGTRADRYPEDWQKRLALVRGLISVGNYYEVLRRLREPPAPPMGIESATAQKLLAETQQRLRQFDKAMATYRALLQSESFMALSNEDQLKVRAS